MRSLALTVLREIGDSDCEELGTGWLVQPINAISSFAYVVVGAVIVVIALRRRLLDVETVVFAVLLAAVGLGSVAFHGPQPWGSRFMHDLPILLTVLFMLVHDDSLLARRRFSWWAFGIAAVVVTGISAALPDAAAALTAVALVGVAISEFLVYRWRRRAIDPRRQVKLYAIVVGVLGIAGATWLLGRTDSPACDPDGVFQFHGLWHVLSAIVFGVWWWLAIAESGATADEVAADEESVATS